MDDELKEYTINWFDEYSDGSQLKRSFTCKAETKEHALGKAITNTLIQTSLLTYIFNHSNKPKVDLFLWEINAKIA